MILWSTVLCNTFLKKMVSFIHGTNCLFSNSRRKNIDQSYTNESRSDWNQAIHLNTDPCTFYILPIFHQWIKLIEKWTHSFFLAHACDISLEEIKRNQPRTRTVLIRTCGRFRQSCPVLKLLATNSSYIEYELITWMIM